MHRKRALITDITGPDDTCLAELHLSHDFEVHGMVRRGGSIDTGRINTPCLKRSCEFQKQRLFASAAISRTRPLVRLMMAADLEQAGREARAAATAT